jgi:hypothetical protein
VDNEASEKQIELYSQFAYQVLPEGIQHVEELRNFIFSLEIKTIKIEVDLVAKRNDSGKLEDLEWSKPEENEIKICLTDLPTDEVTWVDKSNWDEFWSELSINENDIHFEDDRAHVTVTPTVYLVYLPKD